MVVSREEKASNCSRVSVESERSCSTISSNSQRQEKKSWHHKINPLRWGNIPPIPEERVVSREHNAGFFSLLTFQWINPLMASGYKRTVELNDIWLVNPERSSDVLLSRFNEAFERRTTSGEQSPLLWALYDSMRSEFLLGGICALSSALLQVFSPFTLRYLIQFATDAYHAQNSDHPAPNIGRGVILVLGITLMQIFQSTAANHFHYRGMMVGGESRAVLMNAIFEKSLRISGRAKAGGRTMSGEDVSDGSGWSNGKIINLMSVDTHRVDQASSMFHILWTAPIHAVIALILLCVNIGYSALAGYALLLICVPLLRMAITSLLTRRKNISKVTDQRVMLTQEILAAVRFVKFFGWESSFLDRLKHLRHKEIRAIQILLSIRNAINSLAISIPVFAAMLAFIVYSITGHDISSASRIFSSLALFNSLRMPLHLLPQVIGQATDALASLSRMQDFLLLEEQKDEVIWDSNMEHAIKIDDASFTWEHSATQDKGGEIVYKQQAKQANQRAEQDTKYAKKLSPTSSCETLSTDLHNDTGPYELRDIEFSVGKTELLAVIGTVGSGKTSLLAALAGDMRKTTGQIRMRGSRAFCPQYAWIQNSSLKENITFGKPYEAKWYNDVVDACALRPDLDVLPYGDLTEIGERGINLSGGQKQRLNIARAIYCDADIVLMDDPLSAVDAHVGRHIMNQAICGIMKDKCRILATHQLHVLSRCDRVIWMDGGRIQAIDTFSNLMASSPSFRHLMSTTAQEDEPDKQDKAQVGEDKKDDATTQEKIKAASLMQVEERAVNSVSWSVWRAYMRASGPIFLWPLIFLALVASQMATIGTSLWLSCWVSNKFNYPRSVYICVYAVFGFLQIFLSFTFTTLLSTSGTNSSKAILHKAMTRVLRAPMMFFDTTPLGRITNRFSKDIDSMDNSLTDAMRMYSMTLAMIMSIFTLTIVFFDLFAAALGPMLVIFLFTASYYRASARELKRHEAALRSTVFARFSESVSGIASIRAYGLQGYFSGRIREAVDMMDSAYFLTFANQRWLSTRLNAIGTLLIFTVGILVITNRFNVHPSIAGLVLSYVLAVVNMIQFTVRQLAEVENNMNATERLHYYSTELEQEAPLKLREVPDSWPKQGSISFNSACMRYRPELPLVLQGLSFDIRGGERIGIVGRTGAGKSSIMSALFRLTELSHGQIKIDDIDISTVGLMDLRSRMAIIPQDPTLFSGTIRSNLDPFNEHSDFTLWDALRKADLIGAETGTEIEKVSEKNGRIHLDSVVEEEGLNFSLGQRQLLALARALVRDSQIIVCDEATSSVDFETDRKIQQTIRTAFAGKTLLCIAHRLKTIISYDRICVMDQGRIAELDTPVKLFEQGGIFRSMCDKSRITRADFL